MGQRGETGDGSRGVITGWIEMLFILTEVMVKQIYIFIKAQWKL